MQNIKIKQDLADALRTDIVNWVEGKDSCQAQVVRPSPADTVPAAVPVLKGKPRKSKAA